MSTENHTDAESIQAGFDFGDSAPGIRHSAAYRYAKDRDAILAGLRLLRTVVETHNLGPGEKLALASLRNAGELDGLASADIGGLRKGIPVGGTAQ